MNKLEKEMFMQDLTMVLHKYGISEIIFVVNQNANIIYASAVMPGRAKSQAMTDLNNGFLPIVQERIKQSGIITNGN